jgi:NADPH:quinone reductase-like Zn-dependent oxidoreductase
MNATLTTASLHPVVDKIFDFDQAAEAFAHMESASHFGKIVIRINRNQ